MFYLFYGIRALREKRAKVFARLKTRESLRAFFARLTRECRQISNLIIQHTRNVATAHCSVLRITIAESSD